MHSKLLWFFTVQLVAGLLQSAVADKRGCGKWWLISSYTVKTFGLIQPYFGHLSCMPVVYVTRYKLQGMLPIWLKAYE